MKSSFLGAGAIACALALSACGGGGGDVMLGGSVIGVSKAGLVLQNNGGSDLAVTPGISSFYFTDRIDSDSKYNVTVKSVPPNVEKCDVSNGSGTAGEFDIMSVVVVCTVKTYQLGGTISGLEGATGHLVLVNGSDRLDVPLVDKDNKPTTTFSMTRIVEDAPYGVKVLTPPEGRTCSVANGSGKMGTADVTNIQVSCPAAP